MSNAYIIFSKLLLCIVCLVMSGCIHTYPEGNGVDPTMVKVGVEVTLDICWETQDIIFTKSEDYDYRLIIEFYKNGDSCFRCEHYVLPEELLNGNVKLIMPYDFNATNYNVTAWLDCTDSGSHQNFAYNAASLSSIVRIDNHISWDETITCASASSEISLQEYKDQWGAKAQIPISLSSPLGRFQIIADDMDDFREYISKYTEQGEEFSICLSFERRVSRGFDAKRNEVTDYLESPEYYYAMPADGYEIANGAIFVDADGVQVAARILVYNSARVIVSRSPTIYFNVERGTVTVIKGDLLTDYYSNSINVNNIWDGEIIIEI